MAGLDLVDYLEENYSLFTVMGVFGAVAIYLNNLSSDVEVYNNLILEFSIVGALLAFLVISAHLTLNWYNRIVGDSPWELLQLFHPVNYNIFLFLVGFYAVVLGIVSATVQFSSAFAILSRILISAFSFSLSLYLIFSILALIEEVHSIVAAKITGVIGSSVFGILWYVLYINTPSIIEKDPSIFLSANFNHPFPISIYSIMYGLFSTLLFIFIVMGAELSYEAYKHRHD